MADQVTFDEAQQALVDKLVGEARVKAREVAKAQHDADQVKAREDSEKAALAANQEWQQLAKKHEARATELEPLQDQVEIYQKMVGKMLREKIKGLGDAAKKAVEGLPEGMSPLEKLNWLTTNETLFKGVGDGVGTPQSRKKAARQQTTPVKVSKYPIRL